MITLEVTAAIDAAGTLKTFYVADAVFVTQPSDSPGNTAFEPFLNDPGSLTISAFANGTTGGATQLQQGEVIINNSDGRFDSWLNYSFDGRPIVMRYGTGGAYPSAFRTLLTGTVESVELNFAQFIIRIRDKAFVFSKQMLSNFYGGTNVLPDGLDGTPNDIAGKTKPKLFGKVFNISPPCVNTSKLTYQVNDGAVNSIDAVYDRGDSLTFGSDFTTSALLQAATVSASTYSTCIAEGYFRLGSPPTGTVTVDATEGANAAARTVGQILNRIALSAGLGTGEISSADVTALDAANSAVVGIWVVDAPTFLNVMDQVAQSIGAYYGFDPNGVLRMAVFNTASGQPILDIQDYNLGKAFERLPANDNNIPAYSVTLSYALNNTVQTTDLAGSVTAASRAFLGQQFRTVQVQDASVKNQYLLATVLAVSTLLIDPTAATAEANRQLSLHKVRRDTFSVPLAVNEFIAASVPVLGVVALTTSRFGLSGGRLLLIIGITYDLANNQVILNLWG
jgi:hypothetical protein